MGPAFSKLIPKKNKEVLLPENVMPQFTIEDMEFDATVISPDQKTDVLTDVSEIKTDVLTEVPEIKTDVLTEVPEIKTDVPIEPSESINPNSESEMIEQIQIPELVKEEPVEDRKERKEKKEKRKKLRKESL